ncbi:helix-turn-helix domain-containing protein [Pararhizobium sp. LjRoot235]|uniref:helix-turn-helix domain-containing protein n=1 Tax=Pararhizobium sp. LjRoot235 TaxID=3342291 RepID=UPI003ECE0599
MKGFGAWKFALLDKLSADRRLSATDFRVGYRLLHYMDAATGDCFPMQETIIAETGLSERTVRNAITSLCACGWLWIERTGSRKRGRPKNHYRFAGRDYRQPDAAKADATTGIPARMYRQSDAGTSLIEHFGKGNTEKEEARKHATTERGTRIPENFSPDIAVALSEGMSSQEARRSAANFVDYWKGRPGAAGRKLDWAATWRIWARNDAAKAAGRKGSDRRDIAAQFKEDARQTHEREQNGRIDR